MIPRDKRLHFGVCAVAAAMLAVLFLVLGMVLLHAAAAAFVGALLLGAGKEYGDRVAEGNRWDWLDIAADAAGALTGSVAVIIIALLSAQPWN